MWKGKRETGIPLRHYASLRWAAGARDVRGFAAKASAALIIFLAAGSGLVNAGHAVTTMKRLTSDRSLYAAGYVFAQFQCIEEQIIAEVPENARVYVDVKDPQWSQRIPESSFPWRQVVPSKRRATHILNLEAVGPRQGCGGLTINVVKK